MTQDTELHRAVSRIEGQIERVIEMLKAGDGRHDKTERRLLTVERKQTWLSGAAAAVGAMIGAAIGPITAYVTRRP